MKKNGPILETLIDNSFVIKMQNVLTCYWQVFMSISMLTFIIMETDQVLAVEASTIYKLIANNMRKYAAFRHF